MVEQKTHVMHNSTNRYLSGEGPALSVALPHGKVGVVPRGAQAATMLQVHIRRYDRVVHLYYENAAVFAQVREKNNFPGVLTASCN